MNAKDFIVDLTGIDPDRIVADINEIRRHNPQRFEMEQLTAIVLEDPKKRVCAGYKEITEHEFWVRGHFPERALMPGVVMLEAAAQLCSYFAHKYNLLGDVVVGFGGLEEVRFRDIVVPGDRLYLMCEETKVRMGRLIMCRFQGVVRDRLVVEGILKGVPIPMQSLSKSQADAST